MGVGGLSAADIFDKKENRLSYDKSSARWLLWVLIYTPHNWQPICASTNTRHLRRCMTPWSLLDLDRRAATTTWLSQLHLTRHVCQDLPHAAHARIIGTNSLAAKELGTSLCCATPHSPMYLRHLLCIPPLGVSEVDTRRKFDSSWE